MDPIKVDTSDGVQSENVTVAVCMMVVVVAAVKTKLVVDLSK